MRICDNAVFDEKATPNAMPYAIVFDTNSLSDKYIKFSRFWGQTFFTADIGLEQIEFRVNRVQNEKQLIELFEGIYPLISRELIAGQRFSINQSINTSE